MSFTNLQVGTASSSSSSAAAAAESLPQIPRRHQEILGASDAMEVVYSEMRGRYTVASRDIEAGECLMAEEAIVANVLPNIRSLRNCHHCHLETICPTPCHSCSAVVF